MKPVEIIVTNRLQTGTTFAVLSSDMTQNVFIPSKLALETSLRPGQKILAQIVPNMSQPEKTPWLAISLEDAGPLSTRTLAARIKEELSGGAATTYELASILGASFDDVLAELIEMRLPSTNLWALDMRELTEVRA